MIKCLIFDLGKVIIDFSFQRCCEQLSSVYSVSTKHIEQALFNSDLYFEFESGKFTATQLIEILNLRLQKSVPYSDALHAIADIFTAKPEMENLLATAKELDYFLVALSNTNPIHIDFIEQNFKFLQFFDQKAYSYQIGCCKPNEKIYLQALQMANCEKENCFYVDDMVENILAARQLGIPAAVFKDHKQFLTDARSYDPHFKI